MKKNKKISAAIAAVTHYIQEEEAIMMQQASMVGMKPAGGISKAKLAVHYLVMLRETLGTAWMTPEWFRFGASSLANDVLMQIQKQATGVYQSPDYFSKD